jgi:hypothetical protein
MRHSFKRQAIHLYDPSDRIPFDIHDVRTIPVGTDAVVATSGRDQLHEMLVVAAGDPESASQTPFSRAIELTAIFRAAE